MEKRHRWERLPGDMLAYIFGKFYDDFETISAARGVCKHWRESSLLLTSFKAEIYPSSSDCIISMASFISKVSCLEILDVSGSSPTHILESCDWTNLSHSLRTFKASFSESGISQSVCSLLSGCHSLSEVTIIHSVYTSVARDLPFQFVKRLRKLYLRVPAVGDLLDNLSHLPCMEVLFLKIVDTDKHTVTLAAPKLEMLQVVLPSGDLIVEAPLLTYLDVYGRHTRVHVSATCQLQDLIFLEPGTVLVRGPERMKTLAIVGHDDHFRRYRFLKSLRSCQTVPGITNLILAPKFLYDEKESIADRFLTEIGRLVRLEKLGVNLYLVNLLQGLGPLKNFLPALKTLVLNMEVPRRVFNASDAEKNRIADHIVETLKEFNFPTASTKVRCLEACDPVVAAKVEEYLNA